MATLIEVGTGPVNSAEREIVQLLLETLPEPYRLIPNVRLTRRRGTHAYEYDVITIAPHGVFVIEVKGWGGLIRAIDRAEWQLDGGQVVPNPLNLTDLKARVLSSLFKELELYGDGGGSLRPPYVESCVVLASDRATLEILEDDRPRCLLPAEICQFLRDEVRFGRDGVGGRYQPFLDMITSAVTGRLEGRPAAARQFGSYKVDSVVREREDHAIYRAHHTQLEDGRAYRIRTWYVSPYRYSDADRQRRSDELRHAAEALHRVGPHRNVVTLRDFGESEGVFYEVTDWADSGTLATALSRRLPARWPIDHKMHVLLGMARGLLAAHAHDVYHGNLTPRAVLLTSDGDARLGDFDQAFILEEGQEVEEGAEPPPASPYRAPELEPTGGAAAYPNTDLYSFGVIAWEVLTGRLPPREVGTLRLPRSADVPESIREELEALLSRLLQPDPAQRLASAAELVPSLEALVDRLDEEAAGEEGGEEKERRTRAGEEGLEEAVRRSRARDANAATGPAVPQPGAPEVGGVAVPPLPDSVAERQARGEFMPGEQIGDNRVLELIAVGGESRIYRVRNEMLGGEFALKIVDPARGADPSGPLQEFRMLREVTHPHIARVFWAGRLPSIDGDGLPYLLMERIDGESLAARLKRGRVELPTALTWTSQILSALETLHPKSREPADLRQGIYHRDIKPANILVAERGVVLVDFNLASRAHRAGHAGVGAMRYTAPDLEEEGWEPSADLFSVGLVLQQMLTGATPWPSRPPDLETPPQPLSPEIVGYSEPLAALVARAVAPRRADRFQSAGEFAEAVRSLLDSSTQPEPDAAPDKPRRAA